MFVILICFPNKAIINTKQEFTDKPDTNHHNFIKSDETFPEFLKSFL